MSYGVSAALQEAVYQALTVDATLATYVGTDIYDAIPEGTLPSLYVTLGPEKVTDRSDGTGSGATHELTVSVITDLAGFSAAKAAAGAVSDALVGQSLALGRGTLIAMNFYKATASRVDGGTGRQIDIVFKALIEDDA